MTILAYEPEAGAIRPPAAVPRFDVTIAMPCLNEEDSIEHCIARARAGIAEAGVNAEILVIDNGSRDRSVELAMAAGARVVHEPRRGYGFACTRALREARGDLVLLGDADGTYDFAELPRFLTLAWSGADVVMGSRLDGEIGEAAMPWHHRRIGVPALTWMLNVIGRARVGDAHCGLRMIRKGAADRLRLRAGGMEFASEMLIEARRQGLRFAELPIVLHPRFGGTPHLRSLRDGLRHVFLIGSYVPAWIFGVVVTGLAVVGAAVPKISGLAVAVIATAAITRAVPALSLRQDRSLGARVRGLIGAHAVVAVVAGAAIVLRAVAVVAYGPMYFYGDSYKYVEMSQEWFVDAVRPPMYPAFLRLFSFAGDAGVVVVQHALGLAIGVALYALLRKLGAGAVASTIGAAPVLLDAYQIHIEHTVLTETLFQAFVVLSVAILLWPRRRDITAAACALAGVLLGLSVLTRTVGLVVFVPLALYLLVRRVGARRTGAFALAFAVPLVSMALWYQSERGEFAVSGYDGMFLYGRVGEFADCRKFDLPPGRRALCDDTPPSLRPGTNYYVWNKRSPLRRFDLPDGVTRNDVARDFAYRAILAQPGDYVRVVAGDLAHYFAPGRWTDARDHPVTPWRFQPTSEDVSYSMALGRQPENEVVTPVRAGPARALVAYQGVAYTTGPLLVAALLAALAGAVVRAPTRRRVRAELMALATTGVALLAVPTMTAIFDYRYLLGALPFLAAGGALGGSILAERVRGID